MMDSSVDLDIQVPNNSVKNVNHYIGDLLVVLKEFIEPDTLQG